MIPRVPRPDVGDARRNDQPFARSQQQSRVGERLAIGGRLAEPRRALAKLLDASNRGALVSGRLETDRAEPHADPTVAISQYVCSLLFDRAHGPPGYRRRACAKLEPGVHVPLPG